MTDPRAATDRRLHSVIAASLWIVVFAGVALAVGGGHILTNVWPVYAGAGQRWLSTRPLYQTTTIDDFQYFPQAAIVFSLFSRWGAPLGDVLWRAAGWGLFASGIWRLSLAASPERPRKTFLIATCVVIPSAITSVLNGQANLHVAALMMHATADLSRQHRWRACAWLMLGLAIKPIIAIMVLLACVQVPSMIAPTAVGSSFLVGLPFVMAPARYVADQYRDCLHKVLKSSEPGRWFEDLRGILFRVGWVIPHSLLLTFRIAAAVAVAALCLRMRRRWSEPAASLFLFALAAEYLMLFNPRTQANSYVIVAPAAALAAALFVNQRRWRAALLMMAITACWCGSAIPPTSLWLKPLAAIVFGALLVREIISRRRSYCLPTCDRSA